MRASNTKAAVAFVLAFVVSAFASQGITYPPVSVQDEGSLLTQRYSINFSGSGVTCVDDTNRTTCTIPGGAATGYQTIQEEGAALTQRATMNFIGPTVTAVDDVPNTRTNVTVVASGTGTCVNQFARVLNNGAAPTCASVSLTADTTGVLPVVNGGTGSAPASDDQLLVSDSNVAATWRTVPDCAGTSNALRYTQSSNTFSCGTITGGGGGGDGGTSVNAIETSINLGTSKGLTFSSVVTGQSWVTSTSIIVCNPFATTLDGQTVETVLLAGLQGVVSDLVVSTGFTLNVFNPRGATGTFRFHCIGQ